VTEDRDRLASNANEELEEDDNDVEAHRLAGNTNEAVEDD
jgi:hypothetical protein